MDALLLDFGTWLQGILFVLTIYHISAYIFTKDKSFLLYAIYLFLVFIYLITKTANNFHVFLNDYLPFLRKFNWIIQIWYWIIYMWFSLYFLSIKNKKPILFYRVKIYLWAMTLISTFFFFIDMISYHGAYTASYFLFFFTPVSLIFITFFFYIIYKFKDPINTFYIVGLLSFILFSIAALYFSFQHNNTELINAIKPIGFFKIGVFIEATVLSIGLGYKYHSYQKKHGILNRQLIKELQKNQELKDVLNEQLTEEVELYKLEQLESSYKNELNELKLSSLLSQMNPHFIFNALNSIKLYIINNEKKKAAFYLTKFSKLIRKILEASKVKEVSLAEELETMDLYLIIENIRFDNEILFDVNVENEVPIETVKVPPLILQPILENAIWHGLSSKKGEKEIRIFIHKKGANHMLIDIEDNGIGRNAANKINAEKSIDRNKENITLIKERLKNFYKEFTANFLLSYTDLKDAQNNAKGTRVSLLIPIK